MKRLRHPIRAIREPFGTAGLIVAMIALVAALGGTALAAAKLNSTQKKEVEKIAKKYAGKPGSPGATGPAGAAGKEGPAGKEGSAGKNGLDGVNAEAGASFSGRKTVGSVTCENGGITVKSAGPETAVCNGKAGTTGFTEHLPSGKTETGVWSFGGLPESAESASLKIPISFPIPLEAALPAAKVHIFEGTTIPAECEGTVVAGDVTALKAKPGNLCVWISFATVQASEMHALNPEAGIGGAGATGTILSTPFISEGEGQGTWAVTAE